MHRQTLEIMVFGFRHTYFSVNLYANKMYTLTVDLCIISVFLLKCAQYTLLIRPLHQSMSGTELLTSIEEQQFEHGSYKINYARVGRGAINVFCCPGTLGAWNTDFKPLFAHFDLSKYTLVAWDPPGYGAVMLFSSH